MKRILFLLLLTVSVYGQNPSRFVKIQITGNANSGTATKVNVQEANGEVNTQTINTGFNKNIGLGGSDVVGANTLLNQYSTTPIEWTAMAFNSGQVVFFAGKQWISKTTTVAGDVPAASSKWEEITFDALANKTVTVDQTIIDGSTNAVSGNAVFDGLALKSNIGHTHVASQITDLSKASVGLGNVDNTSDLSKPLSTATINALATKAPISSVHNPVTLGTANGLSLATQQISLGLASSGVTGALSGTDWNNFNSKFNTPTGLTTNNLPKWNGSGFGNSTWQEFAGGRLSNTGNDDLINQLQVNGSGFFNSNLNIKGSFTSVDTGVAGGNTAFRIEGFSNPTSSVYETRISFSPWNYNGSSFAFREALSLNSNLTATFSSSVTATSFNGSATLTGTPTAPTAPAGTNTTQIATTAFVQAAAIARPYKVYTALLSQTGTDAPTATVLENTTGETPTLFRTNVGTYAISLTSPQNKTFVLSTPATNFIFQNIFVNSGGTAVRISTASLVGSTITNTDGLLQRTPIEIRIYP